MFADWLQFGRGGAGAYGTWYFDDEFRTRAFLRFDAYASAVGLQDLIHDGQTQARAAGESGLKGFENARGLRRDRMPMPVSPNRMRAQFSSASMLR